MSRNGRAGAKFETDLADYAKTHGHPNTHRLHQGGSKDIGDLWFPGWVIEAKNEKTRDVPGALREARKEAENAGVTRFAAVHKYRNHSIAESVVSVPYWLWLEMIAEDLR